MEQIYYCQKEFVMHEIETDGTHFELGPSNLAFKQIWNLINIHLEWMQACNVRGCIMRSLVDLPVQRTVTPVGI